MTCSIVGTVGAPSDIPRRTGTTPGSGSEWMNIVYMCVCVCVVRVERKEERRNDEEEWKGKRVHTTTHMYDSFRTERHPAERRKHMCDHLIVVSLSLSLFSSSMLHLRFSPHSRIYTNEFNSAWSLSVSLFLSLSLSPQPRSSFVSSCPTVTCRISFLKMAA